MREYGSELDEATIEGYLITGTANVPKDRMKLVSTVAEQYEGGIYRMLRKQGYDGNTIDLIVKKGGGCLVKNFYRTKGNRVRFIDDIRAAAKGYEYLAELQLKAERGV